jgi:hypothetical protein
MVSPKSLFSVPDFNNTSKIANEENSSIEMTPPSGLGMLLLKG